MIGRQARFILQKWFLKNIENP